MPSKHTAPLPRVYWSTAGYEVKDIKGGEVRVEGVIRKLGRSFEGEVYEHGNGVTKRHFWPWRKLGLD